MTFAQPLWIIAGFIICIGTLFFLRGMRKRRLATLEKFAATHLVEKLTRNVSTKRQIAKKILLLLALFCCFIALARPQYSFKWEDIKRKGIDILFAVDTSKSMLARDIKPDRLERAKYAIMDFVGRLDGDRVGLLPFAGTAYLMCPLTGDYSAFDNSLKAVNTSMIPKGGTDIGAAIRQAESVLTNEANYKLLILITDGENLQGDVLAAAKDAAKKGVRIFTVGVGTREGEIIPISSGGTTKFVKDSSGNFVVSHLDEAMLTQIAKIANGVYVPLGNRGQGLQTIYQEKLSLVPKEELTQRRHKVPVERFQWPLAAAIALLSLEFTINTRKSMPFGAVFWKFSGRGKDKKGGGLLLLILSLGLLLHPIAASASTGEKAYNTGDYQKAMTVYEKLLKKHPEDPKLQYDLGTVSYKSKKFDQAITAFTNALKSKDLDLQQKAYYNRGDALYRKGEETSKTDPQETLDKWQQAVESYKASLELKSNDQDSIFNQKLVQKKIDELKKQQNKQQKNQDSEKKQKNTEQKEGKENRKEQGQDITSHQHQKPSAEQKKENRDGNKQPEPTEPKKDAQQKQAEAQAEKAKKEAATQAKATARDKELRKEGKMTKEDALQLLDSLKGEEGRLNFVPNGEKGSTNEPRRDW